MKAIRKSGVTLMITLLFIAGTSDPDLSAQSLDPAQEESPEFIRQNHIVERWTYYRYVDPEYSDHPEFVASIECFDVHGRLERRMRRNVSGCRMGRWIEEFWYDDRGRVVEKTIQRIGLWDWEVYPEGRSVIRYVYERTGRAAEENKLASIVTMGWSYDKGAADTSIERFWYDEAGQMVRRVTGTGYDYEYVYRDSLLIEYRCLTPDADIWIENPEYDQNRMLEEYRVRNSFDGMGRLVETRTCHYGGLEEFARFEYGPDSQVARSETGWVDEQGEEKPYVRALRVGVPVDGARSGFVPGIYRTEYRTVSSGVLQDSLRSGSSGVLQDSLRSDHAERGVSIQ